MNALSMKLTFVGCLRSKVEVGELRFRFAEVFVEHCKLFMMKSELTCDRKKSKTLRGITPALPRSSLPLSCPKFMSRLQRDSDCSTGRHLDGDGDTLFVADTEPALLGS